MNKVEEKINWSNLFNTSYGPSIGCKIQFMLEISNLPKATKTIMVTWSKAWILTYDVLISDKNK
jgi:hypothetical protein